VPPARRRLHFLTFVLFAINLSPKVSVNDPNRYFLHRLVLLAKIALQSIHSTVTSLIVAELKQSVRIARDHVAAATYPKPDAATHGLSAVDARHRDWNASMKNPVSNR
jgi:hypothetical protein